MLTMCLLCVPSLIMKYTSAVLSAASGSVGGMTYSRNKGGSYCRARAVPTNRRSALQEVMRAILGSLSNMWSKLLDSDRAGWTAYADNVLMVNTLGASRKISSLAHFIRCNAIRLKVFGYQYLVHVAPSVYNLGATPIITGVTAQCDVNGIPQLSYTAFISDAPAVAEPVTKIMVFASRPKDATCLARNGIFNYVHAVPVAALAAQPQACISPVDLGYNKLGGQRLDFEMAVSREDGRYSARGKGSIIVTPYVP